MLLLRPVPVHHLQVSFKAAQPHLSHACLSSTIHVTWIGDAGDKKMGCRKGCTSDLGLAMHLQLPKGLQCLGGSPGPCRRTS